MHNSWLALAATSHISGSIASTAAIWPATSRSVSIRGTRDLTRACTARSGSLGCAIDARRSMPWVAQQISTARQARTLPTTSRSLRTAVQPIDTWSSCLPDVGIVSTLAGWASTLFSLTREAAVYCASMKPELVPAAGARNGGRPRENAGSSIRSTRRSLIEASSASPIASMSAANASGSPWKFPVVITSPSGTITGLSTTAPSSMVITCRA